MKLAPAILALTTLSVPAVLSAAAPPKLHAFWPTFPPTQTLQPIAPLQSSDENVTAQTLAGLVARRSRNTGTGEYLWLATNHPSYLRWKDRMLQATAARELPAADLWTLASRYHRSGLVRGYILYRADVSQRELHQPGPLDLSVNVATSLCAPFNAIAVPEAAEARAKAAGLTRLFDARGVSEETCFRQFRNRFSRSVVAMQDPKVATIRAEAVALNAFVLTQPGKFYENVLEWSEPGRPILGWGVGDENKITSPVSRWGNFITATDWCQNLPPLATSRSRHTPKPLLRPTRHPLDGVWNLPWEKNVHYAAFVMSDGDNVQWWMGDFSGARERSWWASPDRGKVPIGWTTCASDLAQLCPYVLDYHAETTTPKDDFLCFGGGYYYPDEFGANRRNPKLLEAHAARIGAYMQRDGQRLLTINAQQWDSPSARAAYATYTRAMPHLLGIFAIQYAPYAAGKGQVLWSPRGGAAVPVISPRFALWGNSSYAQDGGPGKVAAMLNAQTFQGEPASEAHFSWVVVHAWSWFRQRQAGQPASAEEMDQSRGGEPGTARGLTPVRWCVEALKPHVRVVTPTQLTLLLRLRTRPRETLTTALAELKERIETTGNEQPKARDAWKQAETLLKQGDYHAAHQAGAAAVRALEGR